jgi:hypothetical protein
LLTLSEVWAAFSLLESATEILLSANASYCQWIEIAPPRYDSDAAVAQHQLA